MAKLLVIGMGTGDPDLMTVQAIVALNRVDVFLIPDKGEEKSELRERRLAICQQFIDAPDFRIIEVASPKRNTEFDDYRANVEEWHGRIEQEYARLFAEEIDADECAGMLIWGDPSLYDSMMRIVERLQAKGAISDYEIIPGISSIQLLAARHRVPLNRIGEAVTITPARNLPDPIPAGLDSVVVVLDGERTYRRVDGEAFDIYWGANLGTEDEILVAGKLADVKDEIDSKREAARAAKGWVMDTYLLRRRR
jgi:precorrin-6A synthase